MPYRLVPCYKWLQKVRVRQCLWCERGDMWACHLCRECLSRLERPVYDGQNAVKTYQHPLHRHMLSLSCAGVRYQGEAKKMVGQLKYAEAWWAVRILADLMAQSLQHFALDQSVLVPVPMHRRKLRQRGYNQAGLLAERVGWLLGVPVRHDLLENIRFGPAQQGLSRAQRWQNIQGAFVAKEGEVRTIWVIDDVVTTGATLVAVDEALRNQGYHGMHYAVAAVTE